MAFGTVLD